MSFDVTVFSDMTRLMVQHPEWLAEMRRLIFTDEVLTLPDAIRELTEAQARTEKRLDALTARMEELAEAQARTEKRLDALTARMEELAEAQARTEKRLDALTARMEELAEAQARTEKRLDALTARMEELAEAQARTEKRVEELTEAQARTEKRVAELAEAQARTEKRVDALTVRMEELAEAQIRTEKRLDDMSVQLAEVRGFTLEWKYRENAGAYLGLKLRKARVIQLNSLEDLLLDRLTAKEYEALWPLDLLVRGKLPGTSREVYLAVEISGVIDRTDTARAATRASLLAKAGLTAVPVVAGDRMTEGAKSEAEREKIPIFLNGHCELWEEALAARGLGAAEPEGS